jgi:chaperonin cofactor prefoldin
MLIGILIMLGGWNLTQTFSLSTNQAVQLDKVAKLERSVENLIVKMDALKDKEEEIMEQHKKLFEALEDNSSDTSSYNY